ALEQHHCRMVSFRFRTGDDGPKPRAVAGHRTVNDIVTISILAGHLLERYALFRLDAIADHLQGKHIAGAGFFYPLEKHCYISDLDSTNCEDHVTGLEIAIGGGGIGEDLLKHDTAFAFELLVVPHFLGYGCKLRPEHGPATQFAIRLAPWF